MRGHCGDVEFRSKHFLTCAADCWLLFWSAFLALTDKLRKSVIASQTYTSRDGTVALRRRE